MNLRVTWLAALALLPGVGCSSSPATNGAGGAGTGGTAIVGGGASGNVAGSSAGGSAATGGSASGGTANAGDTNGGSPPAGDGVVVGAPDMHCANRPIGMSDPAVCNGAPIGGSSATGSGGAGGASGGGGTGGTSSDENGGGGAAAAVDCSLVHDSGYGDTLFNTSGDDDECKYHMTWTSTPVQLNQPFTITAVAFDIATGKPLATIPAQKPGTPALSRIEPYMPCDISHQPPSADYTAKVTEIGPGKFTVGPVVFDKSGRWVVRYHYYEECLNSATTPHAHIAFFIDVP